MMHCAQTTCTGGTGMGGRHLQYNIVARVTRRPNSLASFFTAARQLVSEVESYFSSDEDGNLDRLELLEGRLEEARETLYVVIRRSEDLSSQNPNNPEMAQFNADMNDLCRHLNVLRSHLVNSTLRTVAVKLVLFSYAFRLTNVDFFREFYIQTLNACI